MRIALVHDDLVQWGGAERVLLGLSEIYPDAPIYTSVFDRTNIALLRNFGTKNVVTSFLQKIPGWRSLYKTLLPLYPIAFEQFCFDEYDLVISHTTRFAKSIITKPQTKHICFCHTPPRFLWHFSGEKDYGLGEILLTKLRIYDQVSARRVDFFLAGSENAQRRIRKVYGVGSKVVYPFVDLERFTQVESFDGGYFVVAGRSGRYKQSLILANARIKQSLILANARIKQSLILANARIKQSLKFSLRSNYKRFDLAKEACEKLTVPLKVIDGKLDEEEVVQILAGCQALIVPGIEDFGLISLEAQALGKPVVAFREGGALETVIEGKTGIFFDTQSVDCLTRAIIKLDSTRLNPDDSKQNAYRFSKDNFVTQFKQTVASLL